MSECRHLSACQGSRQAEGCYCGAGMDSSSLQTHQPRWQVVMLSPGDQALFCISSTDQALLSNPSPAFISFQQLMRQLEPIHRDKASHREPARKYQAKHLPRQEFSGVTGQPPASFLRLEVHFFAIAHRLSLCSLDALQQRRSRTSPQKPLPGSPTPPFGFPPLQSQQVRCGKKPEMEEEQSVEAQGVKMPQVFAQLHLSPRGPLGLINKR